MKNASPRNNTPRCEICGREITDPISIARGVGPECLIKRSTFLAAAGSSLVEIQTLELSANPQVLRWIRCANRAIGCGRLGDVERFILAAREVSA